MGIGDISRLGVLGQATNMWSGKTLEAVSVRFGMGWLMVARTPKQVKTSTFPPSYEISLTLDFRYGCGKQKRIV